MPIASIAAIRAILAAKFVLDALILVSQSRDIDYRYACARERAPQ